MTQRCTMRTACDSDVVILVGTNIAFCDDQDSGDTEMESVTPGTL